MSHSVSVFRSGKFSHILKAKFALKRIASGHMRWINEKKREVEEVVFDPHRHCGLRIFHDPPPSAKFDWKPKPSGVERIRVWQSRWSIQAK